MYIIHMDTTYGINCITHLLRCLSTDAAMTAKVLTAKHLKKDVIEELEKK